jgi:hypothetical protein
MVRDVIREFGTWKTSHEVFERLAEKYPEQFSNSSNSDLSSDYLSRMDEVKASSTAKVRNKFYMLDEFIGTNSAEPTPEVIKDELENFLGFKKEKEGDRAFNYLLTKTDHDHLNSITSLVKNNTAIGARDRKLFNALLQRQKVKGYDIKHDLVFLSN